MERYAAYKDSGVEWIGEIPEGWKAEKFRWTLKQISRAPEDDDEIITCFRDGEVTLRKNRREDGFTMSDKEIGYQHICNGDLVIHGMDGFAGAIGISDSNGKASPVLMVFDNLKQGGDLRYYKYLLRIYALKNIFVALSTTIRVRSCDLNWNKLANIPLVVPSDSEQVAIADYLDKKTAEIDGIVEETERSIELLREYRKSVISEAVTHGLNQDAPMKDSGIEWIGKIPEGWHLSRLTWLCSFHNGDRGTNYPSGDDMVDEGVPFISTDAIHGKTIDARACKFITEEKYNQLGGVKLQVNDIAYCLRGSVGTCALNDVFECGTVASSLMVIRARSCNPLWLYYILESELVSRQFNELMNGTCAANLAADDVSKFATVLPSLEEQREIADHLDAKTAEIDGLIADKEKQVELLKEYRKSLISEAVTGKFKVPGLE